jgi:hypothetical protein
VCGVSVYRTGIIPEYREKNTLAGSANVPMTSILDKKIDTRRLSEYSEIAVARKKRDALVSAALRDECVAETGPTASRQHFRSQQSRPLPVTGCGLKQG